MRNNLVQAQNWAEDVRECISMVKLWSKDHKCDINRIQMDDINKLLRSSNVPCNEPAHLQLQVRMFSVYGFSLYLMSWVMEHEYPLILAKSCVGTPTRS